MKDVNLPSGSHLEPRVVTDTLLVPESGLCVMMEPAAETVQAQILPLCLCYSHNKTVPAP